jgi:glutamate dehydrogenase (NAD(P)+)
MKEAFENVYKTSKEYNCNMKSAALVAAISRLEKAMKLRGLWPS